ncbi:glycosyltransferase family 69 protein [Xylona heveae TC161]|uniref:Glycosyltransferase family 69 protein n=1 Tax=Xylona heveae (strain CBS 132557 / TC161) TaxID=1328760 RepID=A0A165FFA4_XYLHT|nr:glycosyltransferase family 69 protein [Xylona heveae TC161]KZF20907.1 glycosyltransferase family 69 protein [Xylona heveae TC161]
MVSARLRRSTKSRLLRIALIISLIWSLVEVVIIRRELALQDQLQNHRIQAFDGRHHKIYIASEHWNNEAVLRESWNAALVDLTKMLGPQNVYVSIYESGSWDNTKDALRELDTELERLSVPRNITLDEHTHEDEISRPPGTSGWIDTPRGKKELRRVPYLSKIRNLTLRKLHELAQSGETFDRVLFLNDVVFTTQDIMALLATNDGQYAAACSLDFAKPPTYYDTFALRDSQGHETVMQTWPYFRSRASRTAIKYGQLVPVSSCWNGIVAMDARPFIDLDPPLQFRGIPDSLARAHLEGSECCLIHADNGLSSSAGVWLNPNVRVGYRRAAYDAVHPLNGEAWVSAWQVFTGLWQNRIRRWTTTTRFKSWTVGRRVKEWEKLHPDEQEPGEFCLINEMQVLVENGWAHV